MLSEIPKCCWLRRAWFGLIYAGLLALPVHAQTTTTQTTTATAPTVPATEATPAQVDAVQADLADAAGLSEAQQQAISDRLAEARKFLASADQFASQAAQYDRLATQAPQRIAQLQQASTQPTSQPATAPADASVEQINARIKELELTLSDLRSQREQKLQALAATEQRRQALPAEISAAEAALDQAQDQLAQAPAGDIPPLQARARRLALLAKAQAQQAQLDALKKESITLDLQRDLARAEADALARRIRDLSQNLQPLKDAKQFKEDEQLSAQLAQARRSLRQAKRSGAHPLVVDALQRNVDLAEKAQADREAGLDLSALQDQLRRVQQQQESIKESLESVRKLEEQVGLTNAIGQLLRAKRASLPETRELRNRADERQDQMAALRAELFQVRNELAELSDIRDHAEQVLSENGLSPAENPGVLNGLVEALSVRKTKHLDALETQYEAQFNTLVQLDSQEKALLDQTQQFARYIDERVLWIRSSPPIGSERGEDVYQAVAWLTDPDGWSQVRRSARRELRENPLVLAVCVIVAGALVVLRRRIASWYLSIASSPGDEKVTYLGTLWALIGVVLVAAAWPAWLLLGGWRLGVSATASLPFALGSGAMAAGALWLAAAYLGELCRAEGVGEKHFRWASSACRRVRLAAVRMKLVGLPLIAVFGLYQARDEGTYSDPIARAALMVVLLVGGVQMAILLRPTGVLIENTVGRGTQSWLYRFRMIWYPLAFLVPLALAAAAAGGYYYTAVLLSGRLVAQAVAVVVLLVINALLMRWTLLARRKLVMRTLAERKKKEAEAEEDTPADAPVEPEPEQVDLTAVNQQTRQFIRYISAALAVLSFWLIWASVLPALSKLDEYMLWSVTVEGQDVGVSVADLMGAALVFALTVMAARNLPGIMEITVLQRLRMESASRYAFNTVLRYVIIAVGVAMGFGAMGLKWSHVQWLVAAMTVGLGFGLQEIFANFVSGLILLFERPIRVGDTVTVGGVSGTVSRIRIRATTIVDWDRKELIVPNKDFITKELVNWTLSDKVIRLVVKVGIAYGSDTRKAKECLRRAAVKLPRVLDDPAPMILFVGFGESSLDFEVRVYVESFMDWLAVRDELTTRIDDEFRSADIEIPFPQRDLHLRSSDIALPIHTQAGPDLPDRSDLVDR